MNPDQILINWYQTNRSTLTENGFEDMDDLIQFMGWPSEQLSEPPPYFEELQHIINGGDEDFGVSLPDELIQYGLSQWMGATVPIDHPLVQDRDKWLKVFHDSEYDMASPADVKQLWMLVYNTAGPRLRENLGDYEAVAEYHDSPDITGRTYLTSIDDRIVRFVTSNDVVAFMDDEGSVKVFDYDGNRVHENQELPKVQNFLIGAAKFSHSVTDRGELASLLGNALADMLIGKDGIGLLDLP